PGSPCPRRTTGTLPPIAPGTGTGCRDRSRRTAIALGSGRGSAALSRVRARDPGTRLAKAPAACAGPGGQHVSVTSLRQFLMIVDPLPQFGPGSPGTWPRVALIARLSRNMRRNDQHDRHDQTPAAAPRAQPPSAIIHHVPTEARGLPQAIIASPI